MISLGCDKNRVDSEIMLASIREKGFLLTSEQNEAGRYNNKYVRFYRSRP